MKGTKNVFKNKAPTKCIALDGEIIYTGLKNGFIKEWIKSEMLCINESRLCEAGVLHLLVDEEFIYTSFSDNSIGIWEKTNETLAHVITFKGHNKTIACMAQDKEYLYSGGWDNMLKIWSKKTFELVKSIPMDSWVLGLAVDESSLYVGTFLSKVYILEKTTWEEKEMIDFQYNWGGEVKAVAVDKTHIYCGLNDGSIHVYTVEDPTLVGIDSNHREGIIDIVLTEDYFISTSYDESFVQWKKGSLDAIMKKNLHLGPILCAVTDGETLYIGTIYGFTKWPLNLEF
jgi:WD40 repeat protein